jgi:hypothetical protein
VVCPQNLLPDEARGAVALTAEQVIRGPERRPTLAELLDEGARIIAAGESVDQQARLYSLGTARALASVLRQAPYLSQGTAHRIA